MQQISHLADTFGTSSTILVEKASKCRVVCIDKVAEHVHGAPRMSCRDFDTGNETDIMHGTRQPGVLKGSQAVVIGDGNGMQTFGLGC